MKKETTGKQKKWLLPVIIAAAVLVVVGVLLAIFLKPQGPVEETGTQSKLYWNVDREENLDPETGMSIRKPGDDGLYTIRFAVDGEQVEYKCADKRLVNSIDFLKIMGLVFDADGMIIEVLNPDDFAYELAEDYYVKTFDGTNLSLNSSMAMNGMNLPVTITEKTGIYDVRTDAQVVGQPTTDLQTMDMVTVFGNEEGEATHVFLMNRSVEAGVYYRLERMYDRTKGSTTRVPDENGIYTITFAHKGQLMDLKCKDKDLVSGIDNGYDNGAIMGLLFDEEGYIIDRMNTTQAIRGKELYMNYTVTEIQDTAVTFESKHYSNSDLGQIGMTNVPADCEIYLMENGCDAEFKGQAVDSLKVGDRCYVYADIHNKPVLIYINRRSVDSPMYYNLVAKYDSTNQVTTRVPNENGYYEFHMAVDDKQVDLRTKSKEIATKIDGDENKIVCLKVKGTIIEDVYSENCCAVASGGSLTGRYVTDMMGTIVRLVSRSDFNSGSNHVVAENCNVFDVSGAYGAVGQRTELRKYDLTTNFFDENNSLVYAFVTQRYEENGTLCYNFDRKYNAETEETARVPDAEGYYVFALLADGGQITAKTKDKDLATWIDKQSRKVVTLNISKGIIKGAAPAIASVPGGLQTMTSGTFQKLNADNTLTFISYKGELENPLTYKVTKNTKIYNVGVVADDHRGEKTTLRKGDIMFPIVSRETQEIVYILVTSGRNTDGPLYFNKNRLYNFSTLETTREPDAEGWYVFELAAEGKMVTVKTKEKALATEIDKKSSAFGLRLDGDVIKQVYTYPYVRDINTIAGSGYVVSKISGQTLTLENMDPTSSTVGEKIQVKMRKDCKVYDISSYAESFGKAEKLQIGDRVVCYVDDAGEALYCTILNKNTRAAGAVSHCEHCDKDVYWMPFNGTVAKQDMHYYLPADLSTSQLQNGYNSVQMTNDPTRKQFETVLDLNGHTLTGSVRTFLVYGTLSIMDSVGTGVLQGGTSSALMISTGGTFNLYGGTLKAGENADPINYGGTFHGSRCTINIYGGTVTGGSAATVDGSKGRGGSIYTYLSKLNMYGGTIEAGTVVGSGGTIYALDTVFNMYGGTIYGGAATENGGAIFLHKYSQDSVMNLYGGTITGGVDGSLGDCIYVNGATVYMTGGTVNGEVYISSAAAIELSGKPVISGKLILPTDGKLTIGELKEGTSVDIYANGVFTNENDKTEEYAAFFHPAGPLDAISLTENKKALSYTRYVVDGNTINNDPLTFDEGTQKAVCPACGEKVTWIALDQQTYAETAYGTLNDGVHVYLAEDITYTGTDAFIVGPGTEEKACVHLNGKNLTTPAASSLFGSTGVLNVMGNGVVTGYGSAATRNAAVGINITGANGLINLYGGTYDQTDESNSYTIGINDNGGRINLYKAVTVNGNARYRGVRVGTAAQTNAVLGIYGATLNSRLLIAGAAGENISDVTIDNATINARVDYSGTSLVTLSGKTVVTGGLNLADGMQVVLGELTEGAAIGVNPTGVFTVINNKAPDYLRFFYAVNGEDSIALTDDNLALQYVPYVPVVETKTCPTCGEIPVSQWTAVASAPSGEGFTTGHYYLTTDISNTSRKVAWTITGKVCIDLNGHSITGKNTNSNATAIKCNAGGELTIMGEGTVTCTTSGAYASSGCGAVASNGGIVHLYGGTYAALSGVNHAALQAAAGGTLNIHSGVTVSQGAVVERGNSFINIDGGAFTQIRNVENAANVVVTGGTFTTSPAAYVATGYEVTESEGVYTVAQKVTQ